MDTIALHEAGHCIIANQNGIKVKNVRITENSGLTEIELVSVSAKPPVELPSEPNERTLSEEEKKSIQQQITILELTRGTFNEKERKNKIEKLSRKLEHDAEIDIRETMERFEDDIKQVSRFFKIPSRLEKHRIAVDIYLAGWAAEDIFSAPGTMDRLLDRILGGGEIRSAGNQIGMVRRAKFDIRSICAAIDLQEYTYIIAEQIIRKTPYFQYWKSAKNDLESKYSTFSNEEQLELDILADEIIRRKDLVKKFFVDTELAQNMLVVLANNITHNKRLSGADVAAVLAKVGH